MVYFFSLEASEKRIEAFIEGRIAPPIVLVESSEEIIKDFEENETSDWWPVTRYGHPDEVPEFETREEAVKEYNALEGFNVSCRILDC